MTVFRFCLLGKLLVMQIGLNRPHSLFFGTRKTKEQAQAESAKAKAQAAGNSAAAVASFDRHFDPQVRSSTQARIARQASHQDEELRKKHQEKGIATEDKFVARLKRQGVPNTDIQKRLEEARATAKIWTSPNILDTEGKELDTAGKESDTFSWSGPNK